MATRYIDPTLAATTATYDPITRSSTGGSDAAYANWQECLLALVASDSIILRDGTAIDTATPFANEANIDVTVAVGETHLSLFTTAASNGVSFTGAACSIDATGGSIEFRRNNADVNYMTLRLNGEGSWTRNVIFDCNENLIATAVDATIDHYNPTFRQSTENTAARTFAFAASIVTKTITFHNPVFDGIGMHKINTAAKLVINNPLGLNIKNRGMFDFEANFSNARGASLVVNNPIAIGCSWGNSAFRSVEIDDATVAAAASINGGNLHGAFLDPVGKPSQAGTNNTDEGTDGVIKLAIGADKAYVSVGMWDSLYAADGVLSDYQAEADSRSVKMTYYPDDPSVLITDPDAIADIPPFLAAGHELATAGTSGSDDLANSIPIAVTNNGVGVGSLTITDDGETWTFVGDSGTFAFDVSVGQPQQYALDLKTAVDLLADWSMTLNAGAMDDYASRTMDDAVYTGIAGAASQDVSVNWTRLAQYEYFDFRDDIQAAYNYTVTTGYHQTGTDATSLQAVLSADGTFTAFIDSSTDFKQPIETLSAYSIGQIVQSSAELLFMTSKASFDLLSVGDKAIRCNNAGNRLASFLLSHGGYLPVVFSQKALGLLSPSDFGYVLDGIIQAGITIVTPKEAVALIGTNVATGGDDYSNVAGSSGLNARVNITTGPNEVGRDGELFTKWDGDSGTTQSTLSDFHAVNSKR